MRKQLQAQAPPPQAARKPPLDDGNGANREPQPEKSPQKVVLVFTSLQVVGGGGERFVSR